MGSPWNQEKLNKFNGMTVSRLGWIAIRYERAKALSFGR
jgi:hypothetical protein